MSLSPRPGIRLFGFVVVSLLCVACGADQNDEIGDGWLQGTINGRAWTAGPGAVTKAGGADGDAVIVRLFEQGTSGEACSLDPTAGRRVEIGMASLQTGRYQPATDAGYSVATWEGTTGEIDPSAAIEIINAPKNAGGEMIGKARFGSSGSEDFVEGQFTAVVCEDF